MRRFLAVLLLSMTVLAGCTALEQATQPTTDPTTGEVTPPLTDRLNQGALSIAETIDGVTLGASKPYTTIGVGAVGLFTTILGSLAAINQKRKKTAAEADAEKSRGRETDAYDEMRATHDKFDVAVMALRDLDQNPATDPVDSQITDVAVRRRLVKLLGEES